MVEVPASPPKVQIDASDFEDPFFRVRGFQENSEKVLQPGTTLDGVQFQSYGDSNKFIEKFYKESNFSIEDVYGKIEYLERRGGCYTCHQGIERISKNHRFSCVRCHGGNRRSNSLPKAHKGLVPNPSSAKNAPRFCGKCHESHVTKVERSLMSTAKRTINITRYGWGAQPLDELPFSLKADDDEQALPSVTEGHAVDGFLRTKCLRCHIGSESPHRPGDYRASGCSSCHMIYLMIGPYKKFKEKVKNKIALLENSQKILLIIHVAIPYSTSSQWLSPAYSANIAITITEWVRNSKDCLPNHHDPWRCLRKSMPKNRFYTVKTMSFSFPIYIAKKACTASTVILAMK